MQRLFVRIFLAFWLAMAAVAAVLILSSPFFTQTRPGVERWQRDSEKLLRERLDEVAKSIEAGEPPPPPRVGARGPSPSARRPAIPRGLFVFVFEADGSAPDGESLPAEILAFAKRVAAAGEEVAERHATAHLVGRPVVGPAGRRRIVVAAIHRPPSLIDLLEPGVLGWRLLAAMLVVGAMCLALARYVTSPVTRLREAVRRLSGGDLRARVVPEIASRRDEIGDLARDFDGMAARLETLVEAQRGLVRDVSHELRSPLARLGVALALARRRAGDRPDEHLDRIALEAARLEALIEHMLTLSRLVSADAAPERMLVDLGEVVDAVAADARFEAAERHVEVVVEAPSPVTIGGDWSAVRSAVENVVRNAIAFSSERTEVRIAVSSDGGEAVVRVDDRGPGIPEASLAAVFEPFYRIGEARERARGGAGLGLAIASRAIRLHGGTIRARNREGGGLEVTIRLPASRDGQSVSSPSADSS